ncbi:hypothetical protein [Cellulosimicrobium marinum]|nr:hypothetical protein [Cellulosimicrobium marinum]MCB7135581.1 hypothetical protein [Cellulosimicrobium marinum]
MSMPFGPAFEAEVTYHQEKVRDDFRRGDPVLLHWLRGRRHRHQSTAR